MANIYLEKTKEFNKQLKRHLSTYKSAILLYIRFLANKINDDFLSKNRYEALGFLQKHMSDRQYCELTREIFNKGIQRMKNKSRIRVAFVVFLDTTWSGKYLYEALKKDERFQPFILVLPIYNDKNAYMRIKQYYKKNGYRTLGYEEWERKHSKDKKDGRLADIVIHASLYEFGPEEIRLPRLLLSSLHVMMPYSFWLDLGSDKLFETTNSQCIWKFFCPSYIHKQIGLRKCKIGKINMVYSGYPKMDNFYDIQIESNIDIWKYSDETKQAVKIIYAPGYSSTERVNQFSTFSFNYMWLYKYAKSHQKTTSWVYRPHPDLGQSLVSSGVFCRVEQYQNYERLWRELPNATVITGGDYDQIFATSDGMILDSNSFVSGYQYVGKPILFLKNGMAQLNEYGSKIQKILYTAAGDDYQKIEEFIENVLIEKKDTMKMERKKFFEKYLDYRKCNHGRTASQFIYDDLVNTIFR